MDCGVEISEAKGRACQSDDCYYTEMHHHKYGYNVTNVEERRKILDPSCEHLLLNI